MRFFRLFRWSVQNLRWIIKTLFEAGAYYFQEFFRLVEYS